MELKINTKFQIGDLVYIPRINSKNNCLIDIKQYYIVRINVSIMSNKTRIEYHVSKNKNSIRGTVFYENSPLFNSLREATEYANQILKEKYAVQAKAFNID